ncbi:MAG: HAMP domain-containing histidine kinase [Clostridium sp.]|nr:HAMP domain-containing histidine kinase [Clostridium sp.]
MKEEQRGQPEAQKQGGQGNETVRVTSIARRINWNTVLSMFGAFVSIDAMLCVILGVFALYCLDVQYLGAFHMDLPRKLLHTKSIRELVLQCGEPGTAECYTVLIGPWVSALRYAAAALGCVELIMLIHQLLWGTRKVRYHLRPIRQMAERTRQLSELAMDESRYQNLEEAISDLHVERPDARLAVANRELQGIERAINDMLERMRAANKQQTQFVSDASHELRTPIAVIQGYVNMLDRWGKEDEAILDEAIEAVKNEAAHMQRLVEQLLFLARGDSNRQKLEKKKLSLNRVLREVYEESVMIDERHRYCFEESGEAVICGDSDMIKQSARILVDNAAKYTKEGEEIMLRAGVGKDGAPFYSIQDDGIGMSQPDVEHAFDRFYRADAVRGSKTGGTGLGLSIAKWIVDQHGGYYEVVSREELGTRFTVIFPSVYFL